MLCWITILGGVLIMMGQHSRFSHTHLHALGREIVVELLRFLAVLQSPLSAFASFGIHKSNLLETRMVVTTYNHHLRLLSPELLWLVGTTEVYSGLGADIVMESISPLEAISYMGSGRARLPALSLP